MRVMASTKIKARFPLFLLLGILFLASVSVCFGIDSREKGDDEERRPWRPEHGREEESESHHPRPWRREEDEEGERERERQPGRRERGRQEGEKEEDERQPWRRPGREEEEGEWRGSRRLEDPDERERVRERTERTREWRRESEERDTPRRPHHQREEEESDRPRRPHRESRERRERPRRHRESEDEEDEGSSSSESSQSRRRNPFHFRSSRFQTRFENENGYVRLLQRFDDRSKQFENLQNFRIVESKARPHTLILPHHYDADSIIVILSGRAILTEVNPNDRDSYNLERGDALVVPAGTIGYLANRDNDENLRVLQLLIPINRPGQYQPFFPSSTESQQSYFNGFSRNFLEASFNAEYDEIERVLLRGDQSQSQRQSQSQEQGVIVKLSQDQIQELSRHAKSSSRKRISSESEPFNLRSRNPLYSNKFGKLFEINPDKNPQLRDLDIFLTETEIREGSIFLPHYHSRSTLILVVNEGKGELELVTQRPQQQQQRGEEEEQQEEEQEEEQEQPRRIETQRFRARLSPGDVVLIPSGHPFAINASSDLNLFAFGINAENNQRNFLAGGDDNVISQIERPVKELAFPGSGEDVERLIKNQRNSHFASAQPQAQQREEGRRGGRGPLSSILGAFY